MKDRKKKAMAKSKYICHFCGSRLRGAHFVGVAPDGTQINVCPSCRRAYNVVISGVAEAPDDDPE